MSNFKESLYEKKSFIYQIGDMYYAIGANTFAKDDRRAGTRQYGVVSECPEKEQ